MRTKLYAAAMLLILAGCATHSADHFYALTSQTTASNRERLPFRRQVSLHLTLPSSVDRGELVLTAHDQVKILEHERWASPLLDQITSVLGQDLEARRADLVVANRNLEQATLPLSRISVEVVRLGAERAGTVTLEARWRLLDSVTGNTTVGRDTFSSPIGPGDYAQIAVAISQCISQLADQLIAALPAS